MSCTKGDINNLGHSGFYGQWESSYGDTLRFYRANGRNQLEYRMSLNTMAARTVCEFLYKEGRLGLKHAGNPEIQWFQTFSWVDSNRVFEIQGWEWFPFLSSTSTRFRFHRLP